MKNEAFYTEKISKLYMEMAVPVVISMVITLIYNLSDTYFVAVTNNTNLVAGVSLGAPIFTFLMALGNMFGQGGASLLSRLLGQDKKNDVQKISSWCFYISLLVGIVIAVVMLILQKPMLSVLGATSETYSYAKDYYIWIVMGSPIVINSFVYTNLLRTEGMAKESMFGTVGGSLVNIVLDPILISVVGLGAAGAAIATVCGYAFTVIYDFVIVKKKSKYLSSSRKNMQISFEYIKQILAIGLAAAVTNMMQSVGTIFLNQGLLPYGNDKIAAMGISIKVSLIVLMILTGLTFGGQPLFGFYYGAGNKERFGKTIRYAVTMISGTALVLSFVVFALAPRLIQIFMADEALMKSGSLMLRLQVVSMVFMGLIMLATVLFQSMGKAMPALILSLSRQGIVFIIVLILLSRLVGYYGVLAAQAVADVITFVMACVLCLKYIRGALTQMNQSNS